MLVGHSYGSEIAKLEAEIYRDVDALVLTGRANPLPGEDVTSGPRLSWTLTVAGR